MPNTIAHLGLQGLVTRSLIRNADLKWIYLACLIPDIPWILRRSAAAVFPDAWLFDLHLYAIVQSSLLFCLLLSGALAVWSSRSGTVFAIMALGSVLHLLIDATQTKWGNGVHFLAPFSWELLNFGWYWPEDAPTYLLSALGLGYVVVMWRKEPPAAEDLVIPRGRPLAIGSLCLILYLFAPVLFLSGPYEADNHAAKALEPGADRTGLVVTFDRNRLTREDGVTMILAYTNETVILKGADDVSPGSVSIKGRFLDNEVVEIEAIHQHTGRLRNIQSYAGIGIVALVWLWALWSRWPGLPWGRRGGPPRSGTT